MAERRQESRTSDVAVKITPQKRVSARNRKREIIFGGVLSSKKLRT